MFILVLIRDAVRELEVYLATGKRELADADEKSVITQEHFITNTVDGQFDTDPFYCFTADKPTNGWAQFYIPWSLVTHVQLLNLEDAHGYCGFLFFTQIFSL